MEDLPTMTIDELRSAITSYPHRLYEALEAVDKAEKAIERLNEQIEEEEAALSPVEEAPGESNEQQNNNEDIQETLIRLEHELGMLEVRRDQIKGELELEYRRNPPPGDKVTEATVTAYVKSHPRYVEAQEWVLEKQYERRKADISRRVDYTIRVAERRETRNRPPVTGPKLEKLRGKLITAETTLADTEMRLEEVKASITPYQLLVGLRGTTERKTTLSY